MNSPLEFRYRVVYESLAKLTTHLSHSDTFEEIQLCLQRNLKYIFDCQLIRLSFYQSNTCILYSICNADSTLQVGGPECLWDHEKQLQTQDTPVIIDDLLQIQQIADNSSFVNFVNKDKCNKIWGWNFRFGKTSGIIVSVFSGQNKVFSQTDIPVLKIASESLHSRIFTISVIQELDQRKQDLQLALTDVQEKNRIVSNLVQSQEEIIQKRTWELQSKNEKLISLSKLNAHSVREPLSRILGLIELAELLYTNEIQPEWLAMLKVSSNDLDIALQNVIQLTDQEFFK